MPLVASPIDFDAIRLALCDALMDATGLGQNSVAQMQPEHPVAKRPELPFAEFMLTGLSQPFGGDEQAYANLNNPDMWRYSGPRLVTASFQFHGRTHEEAYGLCVAWQAALDQEPTRERLARGGLAIWRRQAATNISGLMQTGYEGRASLTASFGVLSQSFVKVGTIAEVPVDGVVVTGQATNQIAFTATLDKD